MIGIGGTVVLSGNRGRATLRCVESIHRIDGQLGRRLDINSAWRDPFQQEQLYNAYRRYLNGGPWAPIALRPEESVHCNGEAIDTDDSNHVALLNRNGWFQTVYRWENGKRVLKEPWHFEYDQSRDQFFGQPSSTPGTSTPVSPTKGFLMALSDARQDDVAAKIDLITKIIADPKPRQGGRMAGNTTLEALIQWNDNNNIILQDALKRIEAVVVADLPRQGGAMPGTTNLKSFIQWSDQNNIATRDAITKVGDRVVAALKASGAKVDESVIRSSVASAFEGSGTEETQK